ncbi:MAG: hypothetical protein K2W99_08420 [Chthoniobacterales bacterium]|nr:hypothetical protein [Chthoniobacterales bacterium]
MTILGDPVHAFHQQKNIGAFAAILDDYSLLVWGENECGGVLPKDFTAKFQIGRTERTWRQYLENWWHEPPKYSYTYADIKKIASTSKAFTAIAEDGNGKQFIQCWGDANDGGTTPEEVVSALHNGNKIFSIASTGSAFAAILDDKEGNQFLYCWGDKNSGGTTPDEVVSALRNGSKIFSIASTDSAFAAILEDKARKQSIYYWGDRDPSEFISQDPLKSALEEGSKVLSIASTCIAFAAVLQKKDGNQFLYCWGDPQSGGVTPKEINSALERGSKVLFIASICQNFAAILEDKAGSQSLYYWGMDFDGPEGINPDRLRSALEEGNKVLSIFSTDEAFAAILEDNKGKQFVQCWASQYLGGITPDNINSALKEGAKILGIASTPSGFAAILEDKEGHQFFHYWGESWMNSSIDCATAPDNVRLALQNGSKIFSIASTFSAFAAILEDKEGHQSLYYWSYTNWGGTTLALPPNRTIRSIAGGLVL